MRIDCGECALRATSTCDDCVVTFLLDRGTDAMTFDLEEERALRALADGGLAAGSRFVQGSRRA